ncbi:hypothetical protein PGTUg99_002691 [Puccinia graminis f. sp. tritici]|uniref:Uncharacterized protein n=1 Tax=Puccinia graminis f. sp. tritici TaxID=56615 RepID=A0A5B0NQ89_PUCGR|nr:hypothetical protein PGTUg99_002691 [Puccinia graminis f. sp. tritici]
MAFDTDRSIVHVEFQLLNLGEGHHSRFCFEDCRYKCTINRSRDRLLIMRSSAAPIVCPGEFLPSTFSFVTNSSILSIAAGSYLFYRHRADFCGVDIFDVEYVFQNFFPCKRYLNLAVFDGKKLDFSDEFFENVTIVDSLSATAFIEEVFGIKSEYFPCGRSI